MNQVTQEEIFRLKRAMLTADMAQLDFLEIRHQISLKYSLGSEDILDMATGLITRKELIGHADKQNQPAS